MLSSTSFARYALMLRSHTTLLQAAVTAATTVRLCQRRDPGSTPSPTLAPAEASWVTTAGDITLQSIDTLARQALLTQPQRWHTDINDRRLVRWQALPHGCVEAWREIDQLLPEIQTLMLFCRSTLHRYLHLAPAPDNLELQTDIESGIARTLHAARATATHIALDASLAHAATAVRRSNRTLGHISVTTGSTHTDHTIESIA